MKSFFKKKTNWSASLLAAVGRNEIWKISLLTRTAGESVGQATAGQVKKTAGSHRAAQHQRAASFFFWPETHSLLNPASRMLRHALAEQLMMTFMGCASQWPPKVSGGHPMDRETKVSGARLQAPASQHPRKGVTDQQTVRTNEFDSWWGSVVFEWESNSIFKETKWLEVSTGEKYKWQV